MPEQFSSFTELQTLMQALNRKPHAVLWQVLEDVIVKLPCWTSCNHKTAPQCTDIKRLVRNLQIISCHGSQTSVNAAAH